MFSQLFGNYMVEKGVLTQEDLAEIIKSQMEVRVKLGMIAVADGLLTEKQAEEINHLQAQFDKRFGDIAVEKGYLTEEQVEGLLKRQGNPYMKFLQLLTEKTGISVAQAENHLEEFRVKSGFSQEELQALQCENLDAIVPVFAFSSKAFITDFTSLILRNITRFITSDFYIERIHPVTDYSYKYLAGQMLVGDHQICIGFGATDKNDGLLELASGYAKEKMEVVDEVVFDAAGEFANICCGLFATALSEKKVDVDMLPPYAYVSQNVTGRGYIIPLYIHGKRVDLFLASDSDVKPGDKPLELKIAKKEGSAVQSGSKGTVLVVDDSALIRKTLRDLLEKQGYTVIGEAVNGKDAVEEYETLKPDVVTLDITMPIMDGVEALGEIMTKHPEAKAIMITAAGQESKVLEALKKGASKFIMKPFSVEEVVKTFEEIMK